MAATFIEAMQELEAASRHQQIKKIRLVNGEILKCILRNVYVDMIEVSLPDMGAGAPICKIPFSAILYISNVELT